MRASTARTPTPPQGKPDTIEHRYFTHSTHDPPPFRRQAKNRAFAASMARLAQTLGARQLSHNRDCV